MERLVSNSITLENPLAEEIQRESNLESPLWVVVVFNNDHNTYEEVVMILMLATQCSMEEAEIETWEIDHLGKSVVHHGEQDVCERAATVIRKIGIKVEVNCE